MLRAEGANRVQSREIDLNLGVLLASMSASTEICNKVVTHD
jgi:hypothetical protein